MDVSRVCDGIPDCIDQTDERNCTCTSSEYTCLGGACINRTQLCDGMVQCSKGDDETYPDCTRKFYSSNDYIRFHILLLVTTTPLPPATLIIAAEAIVSTVGSTPTLPVKIIDIQKKIYIDSFC